MSETRLPDPSTRLNLAFSAVSARMRGLNFVNPALAVEAVGFRPWHGLWLGALVTPWCINLMLLPGAPSAWSTVAQGATRRYRFPAGDFDFVGARDTDIGEYQMCSLISPVLEFGDQSTAREVATLALDALLDTANAPAANPRRDAERPVAQPKVPDRAALSKRDFLRGRFAQPVADA